jgi:hypothetical protein
LTTLSLRNADETETFSLFPTGAIALANFSRKSKLKPSCFPVFKAIAIKDSTSLPLLLLPAKTNMLEGN